MVIFPQVGESQYEVKESNVSGLEIEGGTEARVVLVTACRFASGYIRRSIAYMLQEMMLCQAESAGMGDWVAGGIAQG